MRICSVTVGKRVATVFLTALAANLLTAPLCLGQARGSADRAVVFELEYLQASRPARDAIANQRDQAAATRSGSRRVGGAFNDDATPKLHVMQEDAALSVELLDRERKQELERLAGSSLHTTIGREAIYLMGGKYRVPALLDEANADPAPPQGREPADVPIREFGLRLTFLPLLQPDGDLYVRVKATVRSVDFSKTTRQRDYLIPSLTSRVSDFTVKVKPDQSFALTGLVNDHMLQSLNQIPELQFRPLLQRVADRRARNDGTQLVVLVTPRLVDPSGGGGGRGN